jgi:hypothetical protein
MEARPVTWQQVSAVAGIMVTVMIAAVTGAAAWISAEVSGLSSEIVRVDDKHDAHRARIFAEINKLKADRVTTAQIVGRLERGQELIIRALERMEGQK